MRKCPKCGRRMRWRYNLSKNFVGEYWVCLKCHNVEFEREDTDGSQTD